MNKYEIQTSTLYLNISSINSNRTFVCEIADEILKIIESFQLDGLLKFLFDLIK